MQNLVVHQIPGAWGLASTSPFCLKLETFLRITKIRFDTVTDATPFKGAKKKLPWIEHQGECIGDSGFIIEYLKREFDCDLNASLSPDEKAISHSMRRLMEENLYWVMVHDRWMTETNWKQFRHMVLGGIPQPIRMLIAPIAMRGVKRQLVGHGIGFYTPEEIHSAGIADMTAIANLLREKDYLMGETPTEIDATAYGLLANIIKAPIDSPLKDESQKHPNLLNFIARIEDEYFADSGGFTAA